MASNYTSYSQPAIDFVDGVKRMVLNYISMPSDLEALCLVFRSLKRIATVSLYKSVVLDIRLRDSQLLRFEQCLQIGALEQLRHIQCLHLCDSAANLDVLTDSEKGPNEEAECARQDAILRLVQSLPDNKLSSFWYVTCFPLADVANRLIKYTCETPLSGACI